MGEVALSSKRKAEEERKGTDQERVNWEQQMKALKIEADEWQEVSMNTKRASTETKRQLESNISDLEAELATLNATRAAMIQEFNVKMDAVVRVRGELESEISALEASKAALTTEATVRTEAFQNLKHDLEARLASVEGERDEMRIKIKTMKDDFSKERTAFETTKNLLDLEKNTKHKESEEWQEVAMNTKREGEQVVKRVTLAHQELEAQLATLELTKQAMQKEAEVKAAAMANTRIEYEEKIAAAESEKLLL